MASGRDLTLGEIVLATSVYGEAIDYGRIKIYSSDYLLTTGRISAPNGNIYYPIGTDQSSWYSDDISTHKLDIARGTFIHELGHVYQYQNKVSVKLGALLAGGDYDFTDKLNKGIPFSRWNIEEQAQYFEEMYYRSLGLDGRLPHITNEQLNAIDDGGVLKIDAGGLYCFPGHTPVQISLTSTAHISTLKVGDVVLAFDPKDCNAMYTGDTAASNITSLSPAFAPLVPARVTRLFSNVTDEWLVITAAEGECERLGIEAFDLTVTPGHEMLDAFGRFRSAIDIVTSDAQFVREDGRVVKVQHERVIYSAATAHLYEEAEIVVAHTEGGLALQPQVKCGWKTYNFEVETYHTYVAGGFRVHNVSLFTPDQGSWGSLADQIAGQISNNVFGVNTLEGALGGSAVKTIGSTAADAAQAWSNGQNFDVSDHLVGRSVYNLAGGLGAFGGNMLMQDLISGLGIRGNAATALSQFGAGVGSMLAQNVAMNVVNAVDPHGVMGIGAAMQGAQNGSLGVGIGGQVFSALGSFAGNELAGVLGLDPQFAPLIAAPIQAGISQVGANFMSNLTGATLYGVGLLDNVATAMKGGFLGALGTLAGSFASDALGLDSAGAQLGGSIGSAIGGAIGMYFGGPIGNAIGSFAGSLIGSVIGEFAGEVVDFLGDAVDAVGDFFDWLFPIILDLDGTGVEITEISRSTTFMDSGDDGLLHRTAWAAAGNGVLFFDPDNRNAITESRQYIFTEWDPTATDDMAALRGAFDTNGDGKLTAADTDFAKFKVLVTNPDGSTTVRTLDYYDIAEINLRADATNIVLPDGSTITGQTTFTRENGTTGTVANTALASEVQGYRLDQSVTLDGSGNRVLDIKAYAGDGSLAYEIKSVTNTSGTVSNLSYDDNGDGTWDRLQKVEKVINPDGSKTTTVTNMQGAVAAAAILVSVEQTTVSADGKTTTIERDSLGGGWVDQIEERLVNADGSRTTTITDFAQNGDVLSEQSETVSIDGTIRTETTNFDGDIDVDQTVTQTITTNAAGTRTETVEVLLGADEKVSKETTVTWANGKTKNVTLDADGDGDIDLRTNTSITGNAGQTTTSVITVKNQNNTDRSITEIIQSADALQTTTKVNYDGDLNASNLSDVDWTQTDVTTIVNGIRTETSTVTNADGSVRSMERTVLQADKVSFEHRVDLNSNGVLSATEIVRQVTVDAVTGDRTEVIYDRAPSSTIVLSQVTTVTSSDGLVVNTYVDADGNGTDTHTIDTTVLNSANSSTRTIEVLNADGSDRSTEKITTISSGAAVEGGTLTLLETRESDINGDGDFDKTVVTRVIKGVDSSTTTEVSEFAANGTTLLGSTVSTTSADRLKTTTSVDSNGDGHIDSTAVATTNTDGSRSVEETTYVAANIASASVTTTTSADGLVVTITKDVDGDGDIDLISLKTTVLVNDINSPIDGSSETTTLNYGANTNPENLLSKSTEFVSANGLVRTTRVYADGVGTPDTEIESITTLNGNGSKTEVVTTRNGLGNLLNVKTIITSDDGLVVTEKDNTNGVGAIEFTRTTTTTLRDDGWTVVTSELVDIALNRLEKSVTTTSDDGREVTIETFKSGDDEPDIVETKSILNNGSSVHLVQHLSPAGLPVVQTRTTLSGNGLVKTEEVDRNGDGDFESKVRTTTTLNADGSVTELTQKLTMTNAPLGTTSVTTSADGLVKTYWENWDGTGANERTGTETTTFSQDGIWTTIRTEQNGDGSANNETIIVEDQKDRTKTVSFNADGSQVDGNQFNDSVVVTQTKPDGSTVVTDTAYSVAGTKLREITTETLANGAQTLIFEDKNGDGFVDRTIVERQRIWSDGDITSTKTFVDSKSGLLGDISEYTSGSGLRKSIEINDVMFYGDRRTEISTSISVDGRQTTLYETVEPRGVLTPDVLVRRYDHVDLDGLFSETNINFASGDSLGDKERRITQTTNTDLSVTSFSEFWNTSHILVETIKEVTSSDKHTVTITHDVDGDEDDDYRVTNEITLGQDKIATWEKLSSSGVTTAEFVFTNSRNGLRTDAELDITNDGSFDISKTVITDPLANGVTVTTENTYYGETLVETQVMTVSANGLVKTTTTDFNPSSVGVDETTVVATVYGADGTKTDSEITTYANGDLRSKSVTVTSADGRTITQTLDRDGNGVADIIIQSVTRADGQVTVSERIFNVAGYELVGSETVTSADGLTTTIERNTGTVEKITYSLVSAGSYIWTNGVTASATEAEITVKHRVDGQGVIEWSMTSTIDGYFEAIVDQLNLDRALNRAASIFDAIFDRGMYRSESETLVKYLDGTNELNLQALTADLLDSEEFEDRYGALENSEFVQQLFVNALGRPPSLQEVSDYVSRLATLTLSRAQMVVEIADGMEHRAIGNSHLPTSNTNWEFAGVQFDRLLDKERARAIAERLVDTVYDRDATLQEKAVLVEKMLGGEQGLEELVELLLANSGELQGTYTNSLAGLGVNGIVNQAFKNALGRGPTVAERDLWLANINSGNFTVAQFLVTLSESVEHLSASNAHFSNVFSPLGLLTGSNTAADTLTAAVSSHIQGLGNNDTLNGSSGSDRIVGGTGNDLLRGAVGSDRYEWSTGHGNDIIDDAFASVLEQDTLALTNVASSGVTLTRFGSVLEIKIGNEVLSILYQFGSSADGKGIEAIAFSDTVWDVSDIYANTVTGALSNGVFYGTVFSDNLFATASQSTIYGFEGDDCIVGGGGTDLLYGGTGSDRYEWSIGDGADEIIDDSVSLTEIDVLALMNVSSSNVTLVRSGTHLIVNVATASGSTTSISIFNRFSNTGSAVNGFGVEVIAFSDGVTWTLADILAKTTTEGAGNLTGSVYSDNLIGSTTSQYLDASFGDDILIGGGGDDILHGGSGSDRYLWSIGDGDDSINEDASSDFEIDTLVLTDVLASEVTLATTTTNNIVLTLANGEDITFNNQLGIIGAANGQGIEAIEFSDGTTWGLKEIRAQTMASHLPGENVGNAGGLGDLGTEFGDYFVGTIGNDTIFGQEGDDHLVGGLGADQLRGWSGNDTASYDNSSNGVLLDLRITAAQSGILTGTTVTTEATGDVLVSIENLRGSDFGDDLYGSNTSNRLYGGDGINGRADYLYGLDGDDFLYGEAGNDHLIGGEGADFMDGGAGDEDVADYWNDGPSIVVNLATGLARGNEAEGDTLRNIEWVFGSQWGANTIYGNDLSNYIRVGGVAYNWPMNPAPSNENFVYGGGGNDRLQGGEAIDTLEGGDDNDIIDGGIGADKLDGGTGVDQLVYQFSGSAVNVNLATNVVSGGDAEGDTIVGFENVQGSGSNDTLTGSASANELLGMAGNDILSGGAGADILDGGDGVDTVSYANASFAVTVNLANTSAQTGGVGGDQVGDVILNVERLNGSIYSDILKGNAQNNTLSGGLGDDALYGGAGADVLNGGGGLLDIAYYTTSTVGVTVNLSTNVNSGGDAQGDSLLNVERVYGSAHSDTITGDAVDNRLYGHIGNDLLNGMGGADFLTGGDGNDTFAFNNSFGLDRIEDFTAGTGVGDVMRLLLGVSFDSFAEVMAATTQVGANAVISIDVNNKITLAGVQKSALVADDFAFV